MSSTKQDRQAAKPYPEFPLFLHPNGQWAKKILGRPRYFGTDQQAALAKYLAQKDDLHAGREPIRDGVGDGLTIQSLVNQFLTAKKRLLSNGELTARTFMEYHAASCRLVDQFGKERRVINLNSEDFAKLRVRLASTRGPVALGNEIQRVRTIFKWAFDDGLIDRPVRFGTSFKKPSRKAIRKAKHAAGNRMLEAVELRKLLGAADQQMKAMILLGLNCGFGQTDVAALPIDAIDLAGGWIDFPRPKTAIARRCPLWPETAKELQEALTITPVLPGVQPPGLAFTTATGKPLVKFVMKERQDENDPAKVKLSAGRVDAIGFRFRRLIRQLLPHRTGIGFYALRHVFRTIADEAKDQPAADSLMGHVNATMAGIYRERISDDRLRAVVNVVRDWLFAADDDGERQADGGPEPAILQFRQAGA